MYDAVFVLVEAFNKILRKKPDQFRNNIQRRGQQTLMAAASTSINGTMGMAAGGIGSGIGGSGGGGGGGGGTGIGSGGGSSGGGGGNTPRALDCNTSKGWVNPWEHGDKISRYLRKVSEWNDKWNTACVVVLSENDACWCGGISIYVHLQYWKTWVGYWVQICMNLVN